MDLANLLDVLVDRKTTWVPEGGYATYVTGSWEGIRTGVVDPEKWLFPHNIVKFEKAAHDQMVCPYQNLRVVDAYIQA
jgi:amidase